MLRSLGKINNKQTGRSNIPACASARDNIIWITCGALDDDSFSLFEIFHEIGHIINYYWSKEVRSISDHTLTPGTKFFRRKRKLFGSGKLVKNENGTVDLGKSDFVSEYAASNASEDFAETFAYLIMNCIVPSAIGVENLWKMTDEDLERNLNTNWISNKIWEKAKVIINAYLKAVSEEKRKNTDWQDEQSKCACNNGKPGQAVLLCNPDILSIEVSRSLLPLLDPSLGCELLNNIPHVRRQIAIETGIVLPGIRFRDNDDLPRNSYIIKINDQKIDEL